MLPKPYFQDKWCTIYNSDCRLILPELPKVDLVLTDPPYGVGVNYDTNYQDTSIGYKEWVNAILKTIKGMTKLLMITPGIRNLWIYPPADWVLCWGKPGSTRRSDLGGFNEWEPILVYGKRRIYNDFKLLPDCVNHSKDTGGHPCPKPKNLYEWLIVQGTDFGDLILDPFLGSGTTAVCAKKLGRHSIGIEISEKYCQIAVERLRQSVMNFNEI